MMLVTLIVLFSYIQTGVGQTTSAVDPNAQMILNNSSVRLVVENQCVTRQQVQQTVQQIVQEAFQAERQIRQAEQDEFYTRIQSTQTAGYSNGTFQHPAESCNYLPEGTLSGHYWIQNAGTGYASLQYCDTARRCCGSTGGWMRVAYLDMTDPNHHCPTGFVTINSPRRTCGSPEINGCVSATFPAHGVRYNRVCGRIKAYQYKTPDAFEYYYHHRSRGIDDPYVEGISLTHGSIFGHLQLLSMKCTATSMCVLVPDQTLHTLEWCLHSSVRIISVKLEVAIATSIYSTLLILSGMARVVAHRAPAAVSITLLGSVSNYPNQLLMILS